MRQASKGAKDLMKMLDSKMGKVRDFYVTMQSCDTNNDTVTFESFLNRTSGWTAVDKYLYYISGSCGVAKFKIEELDLLIEELQEIKDQLELRGMR